MTISTCRLADPSPDRHYAAHAHPCQSTVLQGKGRTYLYSTIISATPMTERLTSYTFQLEEVSRGRCRLKYLILQGWPSPVPPHQENLDHCIYGNLHMCFISLSQTSIQHTSCCHHHHDRHLPFQSLNSPSLARKVVGSAWNSFRRLTFSLPGYPWLTRVNISSHIGPGGYTFAPRE
jgi:hypothetical protein